MNGHPQKTGAPLTPEQQAIVDDLIALRDQISIPGDPVSAKPSHNRPIKKSINMRLDSDVIAWLKRDGQGYQTRINQVLRALMLQGSSPTDRNYR
jgi:uncharacterized protein (DUF4415 family)